MPTFTDPVGPTQEGVAEFGQPPRHVVHGRNTPPNSPGRVMVRLVPSTLIGCFLTGWTLLQLLGLTIGVDVPAKVIERQVHYGYRRATSYSVLTRFRYGKRIITVNLDCGRSFYDGERAVDHGDFGLTTVRVVGRPAPLYVILVPQIGAAWFWLITRSVLTVFWDTMVVLFWWSAVYLPIRNRRLIETGTPTAGRVVRRKLRVGYDTLYVVEYQYEPRSIAMRREETLTGNMYVNLASDHVQPGREVTVFYDPAHPKRSYAYEIGDWHIVA